MDAQHSPNRLIQFQASVLNGQTHEIYAFIEALAQEASNTYLVALATEYKFVTFWDPALYEGQRIMLARDLARLCYGIDATQGLGQLCQRHGFPFLSLKGAAKHYVSQLLQHFSLSKFASHQRFVTWDHVLIATANGETKFARKVWSHIQNNIMYAFADMESRRQTGKGLQENITGQQGKAEHKVSMNTRKSQPRAPQEEQTPYQPPQRLLDRCPSCGCVVLRGLAMPEGKIKRLDPVEVPLGGRAHDCEEALAWELTVQGLRWNTVRVVAQQRQASA